MKKEFAISILVGALLGFGIVGLIWTQKKTAGNKSGADQLSPTPTQTSTGSTPSPLKEKPILEVNSPQDGSISSKEKINVLGKTEPQATVVIVWEEGEDILIADDNGQFQTDITLRGGENLIEITSYTKSGKQENKSITVTYSTAKF